VYCALRVEAVFEGSLERWRAYLPARKPPMIIRRRGRESTSVFNLGCPWKRTTMLQREFGSFPMAVDLTPACAADLRKPIYEIELRTTQSDFEDILH